MVFAGVERSGFSPGSHSTSLEYDRFPSVSIFPLSSLDSLSHLRTVVLGIFLAILAFIIYDTWNERERLIGVGGMAFFILLMFTLSTNRWKVSLHGKSRMKLKKPTVVRSAGVRFSGATSSSS